VRFGLDEHQYQFEWDDAKAASNIRKHDVSFELASSVFHDPRILTVVDTTHSELKERWFSIGLVGTGAMVSVSYLCTECEPGLTKIRLISARRATVTEIRYYTEANE